MAYKKTIVIEDANIWLSFLIGSPYPKITRDPKDDYIIELAVSTKADYIVTNDNDLLTINKHQNTQIVSLATFATKYYQQKATQYARKAKEFERIAKKETKKSSGRHM